jgi:hypothetical protein
MDFRNVLFLVFVSLLLFGTAFAQKTVNDFEIDESYSHEYGGAYNSLYLNRNQDSGIAIYKNLIGDADDVGDVDDDSDAYDGLVHDNGRDYLTPDDDFKIDKNSDNTVTFTDYDHAEHGVAEVVSVDGGEFIIVFWAKDGSNVDNSDLISQLNEFNKNNDVKPIEF